MTTVAQIEAAIDALPTPEQEQLYSHLTAKLYSHAEQSHAGADRDPVLELIDRLALEAPSDGPTNVGANYKEYLYGHGSVE